MLRTNFLKTAFASMLVVCAMGFYSCSSDDGEPETPPTESSIVGKWDVQSNTRATGDTKYGSFEFTADNKYIITQPAVATNGDKYMLVIFGDYVVGKNESNDFTLNLKEFGTIKISITENHASITIDGVVYVAVKSQDMDLSDSDKKLIGTWKISSKYGSEDDSKITDEGTWTFTSAGTYVIASPDGEVENGTWSMKSNNVVSVTYQSYSMSIPDGGSQSEITVEYTTDDLTISKLTSNEFILEEPDDMSDDTILVFGEK
ncbi:hypothetical protein [Bacteroides fragilis]|uniref:hypothetical protein n=1 Tax=Bacteroides fragilis TaxID=817 RepID=UPI001C70075E|nr:hypothetical protein [Bacteroides fragilis]MBW9279501.1 hypothetical protein [Bacteroides fragilis]